MDDRNAAIPFFAHEGEMTRMERTNKRLWILVLVLVFTLVGTNAAWIIYENQYEDQEYTVRVEQETDGAGANTFTGNTIRMIGGDDNGERDSDDHGPDAGEESNR